MPLAQKVANSAAFAFFSFIAAAKFLEEGRELNMKTSKNVCTRQPFQACWNRRGEMGVGHCPQILGDQLTLSQPETGHLNIIKKL